MLFIVVLICAGCMKNEMTATWQLFLVAFMINSGIFVNVIVKVIPAQLTTKITQNPDKKIAIRSIINKESKVQLPGSNNQPTQATRSNQTLIAKIPKSKSTKNNQDSSS
ncbi:hypothetical protein Droror1_Dr00024677 [Drosera rotundifolia]